MLEGATYRVSFRINASFTRSVLVFTEDDSGDDVIKLGRLGLQASGQRGAQAAATLPIAQIERVGATYAAS